MYQHFEDKSAKIFNLLIEKVKDINCRKILDRVQSIDEIISESKIFVCLFSHVFNISTICHAWSVN